MGNSKEKELDEFISYQTKAPELTQEIKDLIEHDRKELAGDFVEDAVIVCLVQKISKLTNVLECL